MSQSWQTMNPNSCSRVTRKLSTCTASIETQLGEASFNRLCGSFVANNWSTNKDRLSSSVAILSHLGYNGASLHLLDCVMVCCDLFDVRYTPWHHSNSIKLTSLHLHFNFRVLRSLCPNFRRIKVKLKVLSVFPRTLNQFLSLIQPATITASSPTADIKVNIVIYSVS